MEKLSKLRNSIFAGFLIAGFAYAQKPPEHPQVVLTFDHSENGKLIVVPQGKVVLALEPFKPRNPAPLTPGSYMLCRPFSESTKIRFPDGIERSIDEIAFKCGSDVYLFSGMDIQ